MSGIVGILHLDGSPVDRGLLARMTSALAFRGPDGQQTWSEGPIGLGHARLRTTEEPREERQPCSLREPVWMVADARVDARAELMAQLRSRGRLVPDGESDTNLLLHAYLAWGDKCLEHLLGDFAFAVWDSRTRRLFCARDPMGVKPFFFAHLANGLVFSNTLNCLRLHPGVSSELNDLAIADFLLFGSNQDSASTSFAAIQRLAPAHTLAVSPAGLRPRRYWSLPIEDALPVRPPGEYVAGFREILQQAVGDRLRTSAPALLMSGGMDSSVVAATAKKLLSAARPGLALRAYTAVADRLIPDQEGHYAGLVARALGIPISFLSMDDRPLGRRGQAHAMHGPEPAEDTLWAVCRDLLAEVAARHRVVLTGEGGDPVLSTSAFADLARLFRRFRFRELFRNFSAYCLAEGRLSRLYLGTRLRILRRRLTQKLFEPAWLNPDLAARLQLRARWRQIHNAPLPEHPLRPAALQLILSSVWTSCLESYDAGATGVPVEVRHPFCDLRLVRYCLRLPPVPWCADKEILRAAARGILPDEIRLRAKTPLARDPVAAALQSHGDRWRDWMPPAPRLSRYLDWDRVPRLTGHEDPDTISRNLRAVSLNLWLHSLEVPGRLAAHGPLALAHASGMSPACWVGSSPR